jgi:hypothetical protein
LAFVIREKMPESTRRRMREGGGDSCCLRHG